jgi:hypothetical protein
VNQLQLDHLVQCIDGAFGEELPFTERGLSEEEQDVLQQVFGDQGYQSYLQDQVNRQIIRDYLTNAVVLGFLPEQELADFSEQVATAEGRSWLSLHMLMSSVEQVSELPRGGRLQTLEELTPSDKRPPHIKLVTS